MIYHNECNNNSYSGRVNQAFGLPARQGLTLCIMAFFLTGCLAPVKPAPKTRAEALAIYKEDTGSFSIHQNYTSKQSYEKTISKLDKLTRKCLNFHTRTSSYGAGPSRSPTGIWEYTASVKKLSRSAAEFTMRRIDPEGLTPKDHMPDGGYFLMLANIKKNKRGLADLTVYASKYDADEAIDALYKWTTSNSFECPIAFDN